MLETRWEGLDRVVEPLGSSPYDAWRLDADRPLSAREVVITVERLNLDATSFTDLYEHHGGDTGALADEVQRIVADRGKLHNPRTGSGGVLAGRVAAVGTDRLGEVAIGTPVVTLVSNTVVPLTLDRVRAVHAGAHQIEVEGRAFLTPGERYAVIPPDLDPGLALTVFDVCGVVPQVQRLAGPGQRIVVLGGAGRAGSLAVHAAAEAVGPDGHVVAVVPPMALQPAFAGLPAPVSTVIADATQPVACADAVQQALGGALADVTVDCTAARGTEVAAVASTANGGQVCFFNMATSFQAASLGAEAVGRDVHLVIGFGLLPGAADAALALVRRYDSLRRHLSEFAVRPAA